MSMYPVDKTGYPWLMSRQACHLERSAQGHHGSAGNRQKENLLQSEDDLDILTEPPNWGNEVRSMRDGGCHSFRAMV